MPARKGDGTGLVPTGFQEVRKGDGTVLWSSDDGGGGGSTTQWHWTAEDYAVGDVPSEWATTNCSIEIAEDSNANKYLDVTAGDNTRSFLEYTPAEHTEDGEVWARLMGNEWVDAWVFLRGTSLDTPSSADMTRTDYNPNDGIDRLAEFSNGSFGEIASQSITTPANTIAQLRGSFNGDTLQGRWWTDGNTEPDTWDLTGTTNVTGTGASGVGHWNGSEFRIYEFGVGTSGSTAPTAPV